MVSKKFKIIDEAGVHARPASVVVQEATKYKSEISIEYMGKKANMKSIISVMALVIKSNQEVTVIIDGEDEKEAIVAIEKIMRDKALIA